MKGQAAMEYLMTYGWALLVIVIVIAILLYLVPMTSPEQCAFSEPGLACNQPTNPVLSSATATDGYVYGKLTNGLSKAIVIKKVLCTASKAMIADTDALVTDITDVTVVPQAQQEISTLTPQIRCKKVDGTMTYAPGEDFSGKLWIWYNYEDEPTSYPLRVATANLVTKAVG